jgi:hypothetical protein
MNGFSKYVKELRRLAFASHNSSADDEMIEAVDAALDGGAGVALRRLVDLEILRNRGAFFTGSKLSRRAARFVAKSLDSDSVILDPACGAGDLLLACAEILPATRSREAMLARWQSQLTGRDLSSPFVQAARLRLTLLAARQGLLCERADLEKLFRDVKVACGMSDADAVRSATHILLNPPFTLRDAPSDCEWGSGLVNSAAVFLDRVLAHAEAQTNVVAILPDVLRSGRRYRKWRATVAKRCRIVHVGLGGQFDPRTDVNVFVLHLVVRRAFSVRRSGIDAWNAPRKESQTLSDAFDVCVGPVVDYRDSHTGPWHKFIRSKTLTPWKRISEIATHRRFDGRLIESPFVAVKRTSRPDDPFRAVATLVNVKEPVAVENHVLVLRPKDRSLKACQRLMTLLRDSETSTRLNQRIRCRHLTVGALGELPWSEQ